MSTFAAASAPRGPLAGIQYLRAFAALIVALYHALGQIPEYQPLLESGPLGALNLPTGVDIFFVISGFIMVVANRRTAPAEFLLRRVVRVVPLYWVLTLALVGLALVQPALFRTTVVDVRAVVCSLLFIPYANAGHGGELVPLLVPGWSLNFEMAFYLLFAVLLWLPVAARSAVAGLCFLLLLALPALVPLATWPAALTFYVKPRLFEFWLGMLIAQLFLSGRLARTAGVPAALMVVSGAWILLALPPLSPAQPHILAELLTVVVPAAAIVLGVVSLETLGKMPRLGWLNWMGDASYSMYLSHIFSLGVARALWGRLVHGALDSSHALAFIGFAMTLVLAGTWVCHAALEVPLTRALDQRLRKRRQAAI